MATNPIISDAPVYQEEYYRRGILTTGLASIIDSVIPARPGVLIIALLLIVAGAFKLGWEARGLWGPVYDQRGWAALVVFSIVGSCYMVNYCNRRD
jgi:hypothetical protein